MSLRATRQAVEVLGRTTDGKARITRQAVEVLGRSTDGKVRVTRQVVEVLGNPPANIIERSVSNAMTLASDAVSNIKIEAVASALSIVHSHTVGRPISVSVESGVSLLSAQATGGPKNATASSSMIIAQDSGNNIRMAEASNTLIVSQDPYFGQPRIGTANSALALLQNALPGLILVSANSALGLVQEASGDTVIKTRVIEQALGLTSQATVVAARAGLAFSELNLVQEALPNTFLLAASSVLALQQSAREPLAPQAITHNLNLQQAVRNSIISVEASNALGLQSDVQVRGPIYVSTETVLQLKNPETGEYIGLDQRVQIAQSIINVSITSYASFAQHAGRVFEQSVSDTISLTADVSQVQAETSTITFVSTATGTAGRPAENVLALVQSVAIGGNWTRVLTSTLNLLSQVSVSKIDGTIAEQYRGTTPPNLSYQTLTLTYPFVSPTLTLVLRNPEFQNIERLENVRIARQTRGGHRILFADPQWPRWRTLELDMRGLKDTDVPSLRSFLISSLGKEIGLLDWENRQWRGILTNPDAEITQTSRDQFAVSLTFEGELA